MSVRKAPSDGLDVKQRLTLFQGSALNAEQALSTSECDISYEFLLQNGVKALNITCAGIRPLALKRYGVVEAHQLRRLGFDSLHLVDPVFCSEANAAYGAQDVINAFLNTPHDAVALAGSEAVATLNLTTEQLLSVCAGAPTEAITVIEQSKETTVFRGVTARTILDTGLRAPQLKQLGYNLASVHELSGMGPHELSKLGFTL
jgi:hypothetical protein